MKETVGNEVKQNSLLKKSTLNWLKERVTLSVLSFNTNSSGEGRKSVMTLTLSMGSSVYFIFLLIKFFSLSPVAGAKKSYFTRPMGESYGQDTAGNPA